VRPSRRAPRPASRLWAFKVSQDSTSTTSGPRSTLAHGRWARVEESSSPGLSSCLGWVPASPSKNLRLHARSRPMYPYSIRLVCLQYQLLYKTGLCLRLGLGLRRLVADVHPLLELESLNQFNFGLGFGFLPSPSASPTLHTPPVPGDRSCGHAVPALQAPFVPWPGPRHPLLPPNLDEFSARPYVSLSGCTCGGRLYILSYHHLSQHNF
jgi:hypothetical protein